MSSEKTIKELKQILDKHNCAIPNGAKKKDLVELVEAIMAKDEDFVTLQIPDMSTFDDVFDDFECGRFEFRKGDVNTDIWEEGK